MIEITSWLRIEDDEIVEKAARASGPGGQHVKTVEPNSRTRAK
jgi:ribosome-associated protein